MGVTELSGLMPADLAALAESNKCMLTEDGKQYLVESIPHPRTTDILHAVLPPYLAPWAEGVGAKGMHRLYEQNGSLGSLEECKELIKAAGWDCEAERASGASRGLEVHFAVEAWIKQGVPPTISDFEPDARPYAQTLCQWLIDYEPEFECSELMVWHSELIYAGTIDAIGKVTKRPKGTRHVDITGKRLAFDFKTNKEKKVYFPQHYFQLAAYELALEHHSIEVDGSAVVALGPHGVKGKPYRVAPNYVRPEMWKSVMQMYQTLQAAKALNPNKRKEKTANV